MNGENKIGESKAIKESGAEAIAGALERLNCPSGQLKDHVQGNYGAWDNS
jgi:hypothetical protein